MLLQSWLVHFDKRWLCSYRDLNLDNLWFISFSYSFFFSIVDSFFYIEKMHNGDPCGQKQIDLWITIRIYQLILSSALSLMMYRVKRNKLEKKHRQLESYDKEIQKNLKHWISKKVLSSKQGILTLFVGIFEIIWIVSHIIWILQIQGTNILKGIDLSCTSSLIYCMQGNINISLFLYFPFIFVFFAFFLIKISTLIISWLFPQTYIKIKKGSLGS